MMPILVMVEIMMGLLCLYTSVLTQVAIPSIIIFMRFVVAWLLCVGVFIK